MHSNFPAYNRYRSQQLHLHFYVYVPLPQDQRLSDPSLLQLILDQNVQEQPQYQLSYLLLPQVPLIFPDCRQLYMVQSEKP